MEIVYSAPGPLLSATWELSYSGFLVSDFYYFCSPYVLLNLNSVSLDCLASAFSLNGLVDPAGSLAANLLSTVLIMCFTIRLPVEDQIGWSSSSHSKTCLCYSFPAMATHWTFWFRPDPINFDGQF